MDDEYIEKEKKLSLNFFNEVTQAEKNSLQNSLSTDPRYVDCNDIIIDIKGSDTKSFDLITTAYKDKSEELKETKNIIDGLHMQIEDLEVIISSLNNRIEQDALNENEKAIAFSRISKDAKIRYNEILAIGFAKILRSKDFIKVDTIPLVTIKWGSNINDSIISLKELELRSWLQAEMKLDTLFIDREK